MPFIVRWPGHVAPGTSDALVSQVDLLASFAAFAGQKLSPADAPDSVDLMDALLGKTRTGRDHLVEQAGALALRQGSWKYIAAGSGPRLSQSTNTELGNDAAGQLYDLATDPGEERNRISEQPVRAKQMSARLEQIRAAGRSRAE